MIKVMVSGANGRMGREVDLGFAHRCSLPAFAKYLYAASFAQARADSARLHSAQAGTHGIACVEESCHP